MRRFTTYVVAALAALAVASCSPNTPNLRYECSCVALNLAADNSRDYTLCEAEGTAVNEDAVMQCELEFGGTDPGCECTCDRNGEC